MTLHTTHDRQVPKGDDSDDLRAWLRGLEGCPPITHTLVASCTAAAHGEDRPTWFYVESDAAAGVVRRRCVACGLATPVLDSEQHWTHPPMHACGSCRQSMVEVAFGVHAEPAVAGGEPLVRWLAVAVRCVMCGRIDGVADMHVPGVPLDETAAQV